MSEPKGKCEPDTSEPIVGQALDDRRAAEAFDRRNSTTSRVAALVANAGLACQFQSILSVQGLPFAEMALLYASIGDTPHGESTILRATGPAQLARAGAVFRKRAAAEFATAGIPAAVNLYLPYYCVLAGVDEIGPPLAEVLASSRLATARVIVELLVPPTDDLVAANIEQACRLRSIGLAISIRISDPDERAERAARAISADFIHLVRPPRTFDEASQFKAFIAAAKKHGSRAIVGGVEGPDDATLVEGLGVTLFSGDAIATPRFLC